MIRKPFATLQLRSATDSGALSDISRQKYNALVGVRGISGAPLLLVKFSWRREILSGYILRLPCLCGEKEELSRTLCPVHMIWP